jgi:hypothetical protein
MRIRQLLFGLANPIHLGLFGMEKELTPFNHDRTGSKRWRCGVRAANLNPHIRLVYRSPIVASLRAPSFGQDRKRGARLLAPQLGVGYENTVAGVEMEIPAKVVRGGL